MLLLALLFVSSAVATPLLGMEQCARGPPYWCQNVKTASICGAVTHCQQNVWNQPQMKAVPCDLCKEVLMVVEQLLKDNATQADILSYLEKACQLIPEKGLAAECKELVDSYYPIIIGIITGELDDPGVACAAMGLCRSQQLVMAQYLKQIQSNEIPQLDLAQRVSPFLLNVPQLLFPQEAPKQEAPTPKAASRFVSFQGDSAVCEDCVKFLTDTQQQAKANESFVNSLIEQIESQCELLGPGMSDLCKQYISQYAPLVIQQLLSMEPKDVCTHVGFCPASIKSTPMMKLQPARAVPLQKLVPATKLDSALKQAKPMVRNKEAPQCAVCEFVMKEVEGMLEDETTEAQVIHTVEKVCNMLPATLTAQCKDLIEAYGEAIIELLVQQADPKSICTVLGLCKGAHRSLIPALDLASYTTGGYCDVCKMAVRYVDGILEQNATEAQIEAAVRKVCNFLPGSVQTECDQLVQQYEPMLVQLLLQMMDPDFVCMKVGACPEAGQKLLGAEECSWGPGFWCKNMETANRCNAVAHCKRHVW
ncbi:prosaposin isoform X1 [Gadus macrocephalus]|uniref:prosaposin isoform X1 n=1 Tax=Gadus macrocephalus TaxID=80720 RepID=UPI0028CB4BF5|nr:prosaposin isoform X1 [Gadus macrocephalus]